MKVDNPESLITVLVSAAIHTKEVLTRKHILADDATRVGTFATSVRSEMNNYSGADKGSLSSWLTAKGRWGDILSLQDARYSYGYHGSYDTNDINHIIESATERIMEINPETLDVELKRLDRQVDASRTFITRARQINNDAEKILTDFNVLSNKIKEDLVA